MHEFTVTVTTDHCDSDGDGVVDRVDNCPATPNADQVDWDGDRTGNACDPTPGTAPVPPTPTLPPVTHLPGCTSGCVYERTVALTYTKAGRRLTGTVESVAEGCRSAVAVTVWRKRPGADRRLVVVTTRDSGRFRTKAPRRPGRYFATVGSAAEPLCGAGQSRAVRVTRR